MTRPRSVVRLAALMPLVAILVSCGQKGPPRAPVRIVPGRIATLEIARMADRVYLAFRVPDSDSDGSSPGDIERIEVYGVTTQPTDERPSEPFSEAWLEAATLVASLPVRPPGPGPAAAVPAASDPADPAAGAADGMVERGEMVTVVERLTPDTFIAVTMADDDEEEDEEAPDRVIPMPFVAPPIPMPAVRSYVAFGVSSRRRDGNPSPMVAVPLVAPPEPPGPPTVTYTAESVTVQWAPPPSIRQPIQPAETPETMLESEPILDGGAASEYVVHNLTDAGDPDIGRPPALGPPQELAVYIGSGVDFGTTACYAVRTLEHVDQDLEIHGPASPATCVVFTDTFPPVAPTGLIAVSDAGSINLVWNDNRESGVAGYLVLRGLASDATLQPLTPEPVEAATFRDTAVVAGARYIYQVVAVDDAVPPNTSPPSDPVTETAR